MNGELQKRA